MSGHGVEAYLAIARGDEDAAAEVVRAAPKPSLWVARRDARALVDLIDEEIGEEGRPGEPSAEAMRQAIEAALVEMQTAALLEPPAGARPKPGETERAHAAGRLASILRGALAPAEPEPGRRAREEQEAEWRRALM